MRAFTLFVTATMASTVLMAGGPRAALATTRAPKTFEAKGIYLTATSMAMSKRLNTLVDGLKAVGGNTVVFDAKDEDGIVSYASDVALAKEIGAFKEGPIRDIRATVALLHSKGIHVAGRICLFHDPILARKRTDLALKTKSGALFLEKHKPAWVNPNLPAVQQYNIDLAKELVAQGVDEVQFDYVRYPAQGNIKDLDYGFDPAKSPKHLVITNFLKKATDEVHQGGALVSIDVYGVIAWQQAVDERNTGQRVQDLARYTDAICPMVYPSHFGNVFDGYTHPGDKPYYFVSKGVSKLAKLTEGSGVTIRPWLQAFPWRVSAFGPAYVTTQLQAARDEKAIGWMMWNAGNRYEAAYSGIARFYGK